MNCVFCGMIEYSWNFYRKQRWPCRVGDNVRSIVCSDCVQKLLRGKKETAGKAYAKAAEINPEQAEVLKHLTDIDLSFDTAANKSRVALRHKGG